MEGQTVADGTHSVLSDAEEELTSLGASGPLYSVAGDGGTRVAGQVGATTDQAGHYVKQGLQAGVPSLTGSYGSTHLPGGQVPFPARDPTAGQRSVPCGTVDLGGGQTLFPFSSGVGATSTGSTVEVEYVVGNVKRLIGQAHPHLRLTNVVLGQGVAVYRRGVGVGGGMAYVASKDDQRRSVGIGHGPAEADLHGVEVIGHLAQVHDVPPIGPESGRGVVGQR